MAEIKKLPGDLPENWQLNQAVTPNGSEAGLDEKHGYNYLMKQVNDAHAAVNELDQNKVEKVAGKALSTFDFNAAEKANIEKKADKTALAATDKALGQLQMRVDGIKEYDDTLIRSDIELAKNNITVLQNDLTTVNGEVNKLKLLPKFESIVLSSALWSATSPSTYTLLDSRYSALTSYWEFSIPETTLESQVDAFENAEIDIDGSVDGVIKFVAVGTKPTIDLPVLVKIEK